MRRTFKTLALVLAISACDGNEDSGGSGGFHPVRDQWGSDRIGFFELTGIPYSVDWSVCTGTVDGDEQSGIFHIDCIPADDANSDYAGDFQHPNREGTYFRMDENTLELCEDTATLCEYASPREIVWIR